jgi:hypothetical protein
MATAPNFTDPAKAVSEIADLLREILAGGVSLGAKLKFVYPGVGIIIVDGTKSPNEVHHRDEPADCTVRIDPTLHLKMLRLEMDDRVAFRQGKMLISGDVAIPVRLAYLQRKKNAGAGART